MSDNFHIDFNWLGPADSSEIDRATFAELSIKVGHRYATRVEDAIAKAVRNNIRVSAFGLATWFAANWWRLRWEPERDCIDWEMSHQMGAAGGGYLWPDMTFSCDGERVDIQSRRSQPSETTLITFLNKISESVPAIEQLINRPDSTP